MPLPMKFMMLGRCLFAYLGTTALLQLRLDVAHRALNLLVGECLVLILQYETQCIRFLACWELVALINIEQRYRFQELLLRGESYRA